MISSASRKRGLALGVGHPVDVVRPHDAAAPDAELEAALADVIDRRDLFGDAQGMVQGQDLHGGPHAEPARAAGDRARDLERGGDDRAHRREVDLPEPQAIDPHASARSASSKTSRKAEGWLAPCRISSTKIPKCTGLPPLFWLGPL
jgi:hypothetical protein